MAHSTTIEPATVHLPVQASLAIEISWLLLSCCEDERFSDVPLLEGSQDLRDRGRALWQDGYAVLPELLVLADHLGCLAGESIDPLLDLADAQIGPIDRSALTSEPADERRVAWARIDRLVTDRKQRAGLAALVTDAAAVADGLWGTVGKDLVAATVARFDAHLDGGGSPVELIPANHIATKPRFANLVADAARTGTLLVTPTYFSGKHGHILDLPSVVSVAVGVADGQAERAQRRAVVEGVAARLKVLGDPTRLTIISILARGPLTIGEIAREAIIAQPTASVHVRHLREAGLVTVRREHGRSVCLVDPERVRALLSSSADQLFR